MMWSRNVESEVAAGLYMSLAQSVASIVQPSILYRQCQATKILAQDSLGEESRIKKRPIQGVVFQFNFDTN